MDKLLKRSCYCGEVRENCIGQEITVNGWVAKKRNLGSLIFADIRDRSGIVQVVFGDGTPGPAARWLRQAMREAMIRTGVRVGAAR